MTCFWLSVKGRIFQVEVLWNLFCFNIFIGDLIMEIKTDRITFLVNGLGKNPQNTLGNRIGILTW